MAEEPDPESARGPLDPLLRALGVRRHDLTLFVAMGMAYLMINAGANLGYLALTGRFLGRVGASKMPLVYIVMNLFTMSLFLGIAFKGGGGRKQKTLPLTICLVVFCGVLGAFVALPSFARSVPAIFMGFLLAWMYTIVVEQEFWVWIGGILPVRPAKRLTPGLGAFGTVGRLLGAFLITDPFHFDTISGHLLAACVLTVLVLPFLRISTHAASQHEEIGLAAEEEPPSREAAAPVEKPGLGETLRFVWNTRLLRRAALLSFALGITLGTADYPLAVAAQAHYADEEKLAAFYGIFGAVTNLLAVLIQFLGSSYLIRRLPLRATLAMLPASMLLVGVAGVFAPAFYIFYVAAAARFMQRMGVRVVHTPACLTLFNPIPARYSVGARAVAYSLGISAGFIVAGIGMQMVKGGDVPLAWVFAALAGSGLLGVVAAQGADGAYLRALLEATRTEDAEEGDRLAALTAAIAYSGGSSVAPVLLAGGDPVLRRAVEQAVERAEGEDFHQALLDVLREAGPETAVLALERISRAHIPGVISAGLTAGLLESEDPGILRRALRAAGSLEDEGAAPGLRELLRRKELPAAQAPRVIETLLRCAVRRDDLRVGVSGLRRCIRSPDPEVRHVTVGVLGRLGMDVFGPSLLRALDDPAEEVAIEAARALEWARLPGTVELLERRLDRTEEGPLLEELTRTVNSLKSPHMDQVALRLGSFRSRERKRLAQTMNVLGAGRTLPIMAKALEIEWAPARAAVIRTLAEVEEEDFQEAVEQAVKGAEDGKPELEPLLEFVAQHMPPAEHPIFELLPKVYRKAERERVAAFCESLLGEVDASRDPLDEVQHHLEIVAFMIGLSRGDAIGFREAIGTAMGRDNRKASAAIELVETGVAAPALRARVGRRLENLRTRVIRSEVP